ncbi:MAG: DHHA2 domain-containing protein, partial [Spirochaetota bacterium]
EDSDVIEILDHHRLAAEKTRHPIYIFAAPVGSTCTLVYQHFERHNIPIEYSIAILLLAGILSDTVILKSPTATEVDRDAVKHLSAIAKIDDVQRFGERIFSRTTNITEGDTRKLIESDFKRYEEYGCKFGIGQVEVVTLENVDEVKDHLLSELEMVRRDHGLDWAMLLITDVIKEGSVLLTTPFPSAERGLIYRKESEGKFDLPEILSRKKQLLPEILRVLEERRTIV